MVDRQALLRAEVAQVARFLAGFQTSATPRVGLGASGETLWIRNFPLPAWAQPDHVHLALVMQHFPVEPPKGLYLLSSDTHRTLVAALQRRFNVFQDTAFHGAPAVPGYEWLCFGFLNGWRYNVKAPHRGDNTAKMLAEFWRALEEQS